MDAAYRLPACEGCAHGPFGLNLSGQCDGDGFTGQVEAYVFSQSSTIEDQKGCAATPTPDDEVSSHWPPDLNDDQKVTLADITPLLLVYNAVALGPPYSVRYDMVGDGKITLADLTPLVLFFNKSCSP